MLAEVDRNKAADVLMAAERERKQAVQLSKTWPDLTIDDSYAISREWHGASSRQEPSSSDTRSG